MKGRCIGFPRHSCREHNGYAAAKMRAWMCKKCRAKRSEEWQGENV